ncbi:MAG: 3-oxoacyl-ACP synthase [Candidatus Omnitrophica bacterium CG23_combo_of_CG06-09_8_20_14_all_40_11]|nr:MAG: 3-oxoacyl-ACP synthase [Candidatus Omnitrophica bacterium CG23_combo_of_CG06-09_8_20_14_all_40_11]
MKRVGIIGVGEYLPKKILTNADLKKMVDTSDEWITTRTGIKERRIVSSHEAASDLAINAVKEALKDAGIKPQDLDLIIVATITPDMQFPSTACLVQAAFGAKNAVCFDISAACAGFVYAIIVAQQFIARGTYKNALVVGTEVLSSITDWQDRSTCVLFGDGAGAAVLSEVKSGGILSTYLGSDGSMADLLMLPAGGSRNPATHKTIDKRLHYIKMEGNEMFKSAVKIMTDAAQIAIKQAGLECKDVDLIVPHQANVRILMAMAKKLGLPVSKIYLNIEKYGNMSSASTATALCEAVRAGRIKKGDIILLDAFGAGLVWGACLIKW